MFSYYQMKKKEWQKRSSFLFDSAPFLFFVWTNEQTKKKVLAFDMWMQPFYQFICGAYFVFPDMFDIIIILIHQIDWRD